MVELFDLIVVFDSFDDIDEFRSLLIDICELFSLEIMVILFLLLLFIVLGCGEFLDIEFVKVFGVISFVLIGRCLFVCSLVFLIFVFVFVFVFILFKLDNVLWMIV